MTTCKNCGKQLSCGCQVKRTTKGTLCCTSCQAALEIKEQQSKPKP